MEKLQDENVLLDIMVRLPVKSILRFRCVSKAWCKLLKDPYFVKNHLSHANEMNKFSVMMHSGQGSSKDKTYTLAYDPSSSTLSNCDAINYPSVNCNGITFWGTCNGVICLGPHSEDAVVLWNPATKEFKKVPIESSDDKFIYEVKYGFGTYNDEFDDFKVVRFEEVEDERSCEVKVYALKSDSWRRLENIPYELSPAYMDKPQVSVDGVLHLLAYTTSQVNKSVIVSFDFKDDKFDEMSLPNFCKEYYETNLCSLRGSLCLVCSIYGSHVDVWEMKTYGVTESWAKIFTVNQETMCEPFEQLVPLQFVKIDQVLLACDTDLDFTLDLYDLKRGISVNLKAEGEDTFVSNTFVYLETLVMLNSGTYVGPPEIDSGEDSKGSEEGSEENDDDVSEEEDMC